MEQRQLAAAAAAATTTATVTAVAAANTAITTIALIIILTSVPGQHWYNANRMEYGWFFSTSLINLPLSLVRISNYTTFIHTNIFFFFHKFKIKVEHFGNQWKISNLIYAKYFRKGENLHKAAQIFK